MTSYLKAVMRGSDQPLRRRKPRQPERAEQEAVKKLLSAIGARFWVAGTVRKKGDHPGTMQTPGLPDIPLCFLPLHKHLAPDVHHTRMWELVCIEVKSPAAMKTKRGGLRTEQVELKALCEASGVPYIHGDLNVIIGWLLLHGYLRPENVPHYRVKP